MKKLLLIICSAFALNINAQIITTVAGNGTGAGTTTCTTCFSGDGAAATAAEINDPRGVAFDASGNMFIADALNNRIRKVTTAGIISTVAGNGTGGYSGDGAQAAAAELYKPYGVAVDATGNLYIADAFNSRIRKVNTSGIISTIAGNGTAAYSGDGGLASVAELNYPRGIALDAAGNLYIADASNNRIRKINTAGIISTYAGNGTGGFSGDGAQAAAAELFGPWSLAFDAVGNLYIADFSNIRIRMVNAGGIISTIAGNGTAGFTGDGGQAALAELNQPDGVACDAAGNIYIANAGNNRVRMINTLGIITTVAGNGTQGYSGDGGQATAAELYNISGLACDTAGNLYIADTYNNRIRKVNAIQTTGIQQITNNNEATIYPNPTSDQFFIETNTTDKLNVDLYDVNGRHVFSKSVSGKSNINVTTLDEGIYTLTIKTADRAINKKLVILR